jgi:hypothetical protein
MTLAGDIVVSSVLTIFALVLHRITAALFNSDTALYGIATEGTAVFNGAERAAFWADFFIIWLPLLIVGFAWSFAAIKSFKRQRITARRRIR